MSGCSQGASPGCQALWWCSLCGHCTRTSMEPQVDRQYSDHAKTSPH
ncbi:3-hydroxyacyl-CoA dehydrogenase [Cryptococcus neoformans Tu259-1]|uniref:3-hydroxyacyl-CoA dehydrogenase n=1 Tax=Cryptococcus neoformans Tu259-1 TaxID=1230072 RepID=A0A854QJJ3_CRYNE|nr:3-hydroxyacyl-CoA dehydrogenase [Cryptococcus neoformans var. grubii Tu259-1]